MRAIKMKNYSPVRIDVHGVETPFVAQTSPSIEQEECKKSMQETLKFSMGHLCITTPTVPPVGLSYLWMAEYKKSKPGNSWATTSYSEFCE